MDDLTSMLWAYHTMRRIPTRETPYFLVYGTEAIMPVEIGMSTFRTTNFDKETNEIALRLNLNLFGEKK